MRSTSSLLPAIWKGKMTMAQHSIDFGKKKQDESVMCSRSGVSVYST